MTNIVASFATVDPFDGMTGASPAQAQNLVGGEWVSGTGTLTVPDPMNGEPFIEMPDTQDIAPFVAGLRSCPKTGLHNPLKNVERYVELGRVCAKASALMAEPEVEDFFTKLIQRVMPKSWAQCKAEVTVTRVFLENFSGDGVRFLARGFSNPGDRTGQQSNGFRWPFGPVVIVAPFNFPLEIPALQVMGSLFMGNRPLLKSATTVDIVIEQFLRFPRMVSAEEFEQLPYVIGNEQGRFNAVAGSNTYVRGLDRAAGQEVVIARLNFIYEQSTNRIGGQTLHQVKRRDFGGRGARAEHHSPISRIWRTTMEWADRPVNVVGVELWEIGRARILKAGDPAILQILDGRREVQPGDYILPVDSHAFDSHFYPRAMDSIPEDLEVLNVSEAVYGVGHYGIVAINGGTSSGLLAGHTFSAFRHGEKVRDLTGYPLSTFKRVAAGEDANVVLPHEYIGQVMVFRTFEHISYGIVLEGRRMVREADALLHPSERL